MEELFENITRWLDKGVKEKVIGLCLLFYAVYSIVWGLAEPIFASFSYSPILPYWWICQLALSSILTGLIFYFIYPSRILERISTDDGDTPLLTCWNNVFGSPLRELHSDGYYGHVVKFGNQESDAQDYTIKASANKSGVVKCIYTPESSFIIYLKIKFTSDNGAKFKDVWIALNKSAINPSKFNYSDEEWKYPIKVINEKKDWLSFSVHLRDIEKTIYKNDGWKFHELLLLRIRGKGLVQSIEIR